MQLKQDLTISSHCGVLEQMQAENVAIVANIDKWDVRLVSSHSNVLPSHNSTANGIIGMSQLVASMLECVQALFTSGASEYQCLSFIESKLREMYLQSETLVIVLIFETIHFCKINHIHLTGHLLNGNWILLPKHADNHLKFICKWYSATHVNCIYTLSSSCQKIWNFFPVIVIMSFLFKIIYVKKNCNKKLVIKYKKILVSFQMLNLLKISLLRSAHTWNNYSVFLLAAPFFAGFVFCER